MRASDGRMLTLGAHVAWRRCDFGRARSWWRATLPVHASPFALPTADAASPHAIAAATRAIPPALAGVAPSATPLKSLLSVRGKYSEELELAMQHALALRLDGAAYRTALQSAPPPPAPRKNHVIYTDRLTQQARLTPLVVVVGRTGDPWRPVRGHDGNYSAADVGEAAIWRVSDPHGDHPLAVLGIAARAEQLVEFATSVASSRVSTLIRWERDG